MKPFKMDYKNISNLFDQFQIQIPEAIHKRSTTPRPKNKVVLLDIAQ